MHYLYLLKTKTDPSLTTYTYRFDDHTFSPANQVLTRLWRQMIVAVESGLTVIEVEYIDHHMAELIGLERAGEILALLGATNENIIENKKENVVLSRSFHSPPTKERLDYFKWMQDLEELSAYRMYADETVKVEVYFGKEMKANFTIEEEADFLRLMEQEGIPMKII